MLKLSRGVLTMFNSLFPREVPSELQLDLEARRQYKNYWGG